MVRCPHCQCETEQVKIGFNKSGSQRYLCKLCRRKYTPVYREPGRSQAVREQAIKLYVDGMNLRRIGRTPGIDHQTVANWVTAHANRLPDSPPVPEQPLVVNELDELFTFISAKKTKRTSSLT